jgi:hypothetical protein
VKWGAANYYFAISNLNLQPLAIADARGTRGFAPKSNREMLSPFPYRNLSHEKSSLRYAT